MTSDSSGGIRIVAPFFHSNGGVSRDLEFIPSSALSSPRIDYNWDTTLQLMEQWNTKAQI